MEVIGLKAADLMLAQYAPKEMRQRIQKGTLAAARYIRPFIRAEAPKGATGNLKRSVTARKGKWQMAGSVGSAVVGPTAKHRHLVIRGHEIVGHKPNKVRTGKRTRSNHFVDRGVSHALGRAAAIATKEMMG
jgi:hypothetical protein